MAREQQATKKVILLARTISPDHPGEEVLLFCNGSKKHPFGSQVVLEGILWYIHWQVLISVKVEHLWSEKGMVTKHSRLLRVQTLGHPLGAN